MLIKTKITYEEGYLPTPRCRKLRYRECSEIVDAKLEEVNFSDLKLAFEDCSYKGKGKIFYYNGKLWCKEKAPNEWEQKQFGYKTALDKCIDLLEHNCYYLSLRSCGKDNSRESVLNELLSDMAEHILVDGELYSMTSEPRYCIQTFGLGHNHGGTSLFCDYYYNENISKSNYFSALDGEKAVAYANEVAANRGDTKDVGKFEPFIKVHMPELVRCNPEQDHGDGNELLNTFESVIEGSDSSGEAGLLCMALSLASK